MTREQLDRVSRKLTETANSYSFLFYGVVLILVVVFLLTTTLAAHVKNKRLAGHYQKIEKEIKQIKKSNIKLKQETYAVTRDPVYLEMLIRRNLRMLGEGEMVITDSE